LLSFEACLAYIEYSVTRMIEKDDQGLFIGEVVNAVAHKQSEVRCAEAALWRQIQEKGLFKGVYNPYLAL